MAVNNSRLTLKSRVFPAPDPNAAPVIPTKIFSSSSIVEKMMLNCSGCSTLQDIVHLNLSDRRISTLDPAVFSRMSSLVELDLTNNRVTGFPLSLGLRHLKKLNCNNNLLKSVQTLEQFPNLEELHIDNNELTVADQYIAVYMLPKLKVLNGKEVDLRETILNMEETLQEQVHILWAESCAPLLKDPMSKAEIQMLEQQFIELLKNQVQFGPDALKDFTNHMLTVLAEKCVRQMTAHLRKIEPATLSKVQIVVRDDNTPTKSSSLLSNGSPRKQVEMPAETKRQLHDQISKAQEPAPKKAKAVPNAPATPKQKVPKTTAKRKMIEAEKKKDAPEDDEEHMTLEMEVKEEVVSDEEEEEMEVESQDGNQEVGIAYEPVHLLRCHSVNNDPADSKTNVWKCAFEPNPELRGASKWTVATCGSNQVCVIDCNSGKVLKKYQHTKEKEEFYCIAWTKLGIITETYRHPTTVLAAAGVRGSVKLLHTQQLICYAEIKVGGRARPINCLLFHPQKPTWLLCGSEDITVIDIGIPHGPDLKIRHKKLFMLEAPGRCLGLVICPKSNFLMAGCDNGCYGWNLDLPKAGGKREKDHCVEFLLPSKARLMGDEEDGMDDDGEKEGDMIDGLALLKDDLIASKVACDGAIHVWSLKSSRKRQKSGSKEVTIQPLYTLEWCDSDSVYLDIGTWPGCGVLVSGDDQGEVWVYDISKRTKTKSKKPVKPTQLLPWPENNDEEEEEENKEKEKQTEQQEEQIVEVKDDENKNTEQADQSQPTEQKGQASADTVIQEVVAKVVGEDGQEMLVLVQQEQASSTSDNQVATTSDNQTVEAEAEKQVEKQEEEKQEVQEENEKEVTEVTDQKEGEEKEDEVTEKEKQDSEEKETDTTEQKDEVEEAKKQEEGELGRGRRKRMTPKKFEDDEPASASKGRGRPKKILSETEAVAKEQKEKEKADLAAAGIVRGRGRPRKIPEDEIVETASSKRDLKEASRIEAAKEEREKLKQGKLQQAAKKKEEKKAAAAKAREEKAQEKAQKAKERAEFKAEIAELRQSLKQSKKDNTDLANAEDRIIVNDVAISSDCKFIVSVTNKNLICIWQKV